MNRRTAALPFDKLGPPQTAALFAGIFFVLLGFVAGTTTSIRSRRALALERTKSEKDLAKAIGKLVDPTPTMVMLTSIKQEQNLPRSARPHGVSAVLNKPIKPSVLYDALIDAFRHEKEQRLIQPSENPAPVEAPAVRKPLRVLLAEDNVINQKAADAHNCASARRSAHPGTGIRMPSVQRTPTAIRSES